MRFNFSNSERVGVHLLANDANFSEKYKTLTEAIDLIESRAVKQFNKKYSDATSASIIDTGCLEMGIWRGVGVTFLPVQLPNSPRGKEFSSKFHAADTTFIEAMLWIAV